MYQQFGLLSGEAEALVELVKSSTNSNVLSQAIIRDYLDRATEICQEL